jgi:hypothetical protein
LGNFFPSKSYVFILTKNLLGYILGDFFTKPSGQPAPAPRSLVGNQRHDVIIEKAKKYENPLTTKILLFTFLENANIENRFPM